MNETHVPLVDGVHVIDEVVGHGDLGQDGAEQFVVVQVVDQVVGDAHRSVGDGVEQIVALEVRDGDIGQAGDQFLHGRVQHKVSAGNNFIFTFIWKNISCFFSIHLHLCGICFNTAST